MSTLCDLTGHRWKYQVLPGAERQRLVHPKCDRPNLMRCADCGASKVTRCQAASRVKCEPCGVTHRKRVSRLFFGGSIPPGMMLLFVTLTAPGTAGGIAWDKSKCQHGRNEPCGNSKDWDKSKGARCTARFFDAAYWNGGAPRAWSDFVTYLRRQLGDVQYAGCWETQLRGLLHRHSFMVVSVQDLERVTAIIEKVALQHGFGIEVDVEQVESIGHMAAKAWYLAKYASKSAADRTNTPFIHRGTGEISRSGGYRAWTASRRWGTTMRQLKLEAQRWAASQSAASEAASLAAAGGEAALDSYTESSTPSPESEPLKLFDGGAPTASEV